VTFGDDTSHIMSIKLLRLQKIHMNFYIYSIVGMNFLIT